MLKRIMLLVSVAVFIYICYLFARSILVRQQAAYHGGEESLGVLPNPSTLTDPVPTNNPLSVGVMRQQSYPGSLIRVVQKLPDHSTYHTYVVSYYSQGLKIYALMTVPKGKKPADGWPAIVFNHGFVPPETYQTTERYVQYIDVFASHGYVVFKPDFRGNGQSDGQPDGTYFSPAYATDALNALASLKNDPDVNPHAIGMWGHSMGGNVTLRSLVISPDIKAAVIWAGVVGDYNDIIYNWQPRVRYQPTPTEMALRIRYQDALLQNGTPTSNPAFWNALDPTMHLDLVTAPVQIHVGDNDEEVPSDFSSSLYQRLVAAHKYAEFYSYPGGDHNISGKNFTLAMQRSLAFFDMYLKP